MFSFDSSADEAVLAGASESDLAAVGVAMTSEENQRVARKVLAAYEFGGRVFDRMMAADGDRYRAKAPDKAAVREVSWHFGVSAAVAGRWMSLGSLLSEQSVVRRAFLDGMLSESQASRITHTLAPLDEDLLAQAQEHAVALAAEAVTVAGLTGLLDELVISLDPDAAAAARDEFAEREQGVLFRKEVRGHTSMEATMPAEQALFWQARITGLLADLCVHDPRSLGQRRIAALYAIAREQRSLDCRCGRADRTPPARRDPGPVTEPESAGSEFEPAGSEPGATPDRTESATPAAGSAVARIPVKAGVSVLTDAPTLAGLTGQVVPYLQGYGPIDPALARALAADATWQGLYRDSRRSFGRSRLAEDPVDPGRRGGDGGIVTVGQARSAARVVVPAHLQAKGSGLAVAGASWPTSRPCVRPVTTTNTLDSGP